MAKMTSEQRGVLQGRINELYGYGKRRDEAIKAVTLPEPATVARMRKTVAAFDKKNHATQQRVVDRFTEAHRNARHAVLFMEPAQAKAFVDKLKPLKVARRA
jgi:hypothetical protein